MAIGLTINKRYFSPCFNCILVIHLLAEINIISCNIKYFVASKHHTTPLNTLYKGVCFIRVHSCLLHHN